MFPPAMLKRQHKTPEIQSHVMLLCLKVTFRCRVGFGNASIRKMSFLTLFFVSLAKKYVFNGNHAIVAACLLQSPTDFVS